MPTPPLSDDLLREAADAFLAHGTKRAAANSLNMHENTFTNRLKRAAERGFISPENGSVPQGYKVKGVSTFYKVDEHTGERRVSREWVKTEVDKEAQLALMQDAIRELLEDCPKETAVPAPSQYATDMLAFYPVGDHHLGMLAWHEDAGGDYDLKLGQQLLVDATTHLVKSMQPSAQAVIALLGDFMHYDSMESKTPTHGHLLDADSRPSKMIRTAIRTVRAMIRAALLHHQEVRVIVEIGNHDLYSSLWLMELLANFYEDEPRVSVDTSPKVFHYHQFGKVLIGTHHGHRVKIQDLPLLMATDCPAAWGETAHRVIFTGHLHHKQVKEFNGVTVEVMRILPPTDNHADSGGYRSLRRMEAIGFHREYGEVARHTFNPEMLS